MKRTIASVLIAIMSILCIGGGYSESDALNGGIEAEEIILDQLPEPEQESEEDMATGDKLVNLDDLKVAYDKQQEDTNSLKSAFNDYLPFESENGEYLPVDNIINTWARNNTHGGSAITYQRNDETNLVFVNQTMDKDRFYYYLLETTLSQSLGLEAGKTYYAKYFGQTGSNLEIYGGASSAGTEIYNSTSGNATFTIPSNYTKIMIRLRFASGDTFDCAVYSIISTSAIVTKEESDTYSDDALNYIIGCYHGKNLLDGLTRVAGGSKVPCIENPATSEIVVNAGSLSATKYYIYYYDTSVLPTGITAGGKYYAQVWGKSDNVSLQIYYKPSAGDLTSIVDVKPSQGKVLFTVPSSAVGMLIRAAFVSGTNCDGRVYSVVTDFVDEDESGVPVYWRDHVRTKAKAISDIQSALGWEGMSFLFVTDTHWLNNCQNSPKLIEYILAHTSTLYMFHGGDIITETVDAKAQEQVQLYQWRDTLRACDGFFIPGNHDFAPLSQSANRFTDSELYNIFDRMTNNRFTWRSWRLFGYRDDTPNKTRFIVLNTGFNHITGDTTQLDWFKARLTEPAEGWNIIILVHMALNATPNNPGLNESGVAIDSAISEVQSNIKANIVAVICGHNHCDMSVVGESGVRFISTTTDGFESVVDEYGRVKNTTTEQAFDVYNFDYTNKTINIVRIGAGNNRTYTYTT